MEDTRVLLDRRIFGEYETLGSNRAGMYRVAYDITGNLTGHPKVHVSKRRVFRSSIPKWRVLVKKFSDFYETTNGYNRDLERHDVYHSFYHPFPEGVLHHKIKKSITSLDIIPLVLDGYTDHLRQLTRQIVESIVPNFAIAISEFTRQDLIAFDKRIDPARVFVAPLAASPDIFFRNDNDQDWERVKAKYGLPERYFLTVSSIDHRKNIPHLIKCFRKFMLQENPPELFLVLTGNSTYSRAILDDLNIEPAVQKRIVITGRHIDEQDLSVVYSHALCFFFMSIYEGFGLPVLEAMQCGTPVISSNVTSLPEVAGDAGILVSPTDEDVLCDQMARMYTDGELRKRQSGMGLARSKQFSWERCADDYARIFNNIHYNYD